MSRREELEDLLLLGREVCLNILKLADEELKKGSEDEDHEKVKSIMSEVIPKYERFYNEFGGEVLENIEEEVIDKVEEIIYKMIEDNNLDEEALWDDVRKRIELKGDSGADVVRNLYKYQLKELKEEKNKLLDVEKQLMEKQRELEKALADCIQQDEEMKAFEKVRDNSLKLDKLDDKLNFIEVKIEEIEYNVKSNWRCDIYGTLSKDEMLEVYKDVK